MRDIQPLHVTLAWQDYQALIQRKIDADTIAQFALVKLLQSQNGNFRVVNPDLNEVNRFEVEYIETAETIEFQLREVG